MAENQYIRERVPLRIPENICILQYAAGLVDTDGTINAATSYITTSITQSMKGIDAIYFMYDNFGGKVSLNRSESEKWQAAYTWGLSSITDVKAFLQAISPYMTVKKREVTVILEYPEANMKYSPIIVSFDTITQTFESVKEVCSFLKIKSLSGITDKGSIYKIRNIEYTIKKKYSDKDLEGFKDHRLHIIDKIKEYHSIPHHPIPDDYELTLPYIAGVIDGDGCLDSHGKTSQHHCLSQRSEALPRLLANKLGGTCMKRNVTDIWVWTIYSCDGAA
jgi:hypothetical protein